LNFFKPKIYTGNKKKGFNLNKVPLKSILQIEYKP